MIVLRKAEAARDYSLPPLTWDYWQWGAEPTVKSALISCDQGHTGTVNPDIHKIAADGTLSPSWVCPYKPCTWHVFARLEGWVP